jgi:hypothetical protein
MFFFLALKHFTLLVRQVLLALWKGTKLSNSGKLGREQHTQVKGGMKSCCPLVQTP